MRGIFFLAFAIFFLPPRVNAAPIPAPTPHPAPPVDFAHLPWTDGERLTYLVSWGGLEAAQGVFLARDKGAHWIFHLTLASRGMVDAIYPFSGTFWSILTKNPWRSIEYGEFRFEPHRLIKERTLIDYDTKQGTRERWVEGTTKTFPITQDAIDDVGTMLYHLRAGPWKPGDKRTIYVYESNSQKQAEAECQAREIRGFGIWPAQPVLRLSVLPTVGTHRKGHLTLWMTDDARRLPLHAELEFKYGTFDIDLTGADKTRPAGN
jgi:hypothetical protein